LDVRFGIAPSPLLLTDYRDLLFAAYNTVCFTTRAPGTTPNPFPPRNNPFGNAPLPLEGNGAGPEVPPPVTAVAGDPNVTGVDASDPTNCEYARQYSV
jgi:hypothetical protein